MENYSSSPKDTAEKSTPVKDTKEKDKKDDKAEKKSEKSQERDEVKSRHVGGTLIEHTTESKAADKPERSSIWGSKLEAKEAAGADKKSEADQDGEPTETDYEAGAQSPQEAYEAELGPEAEVLQEAQELIAEANHHQLAAEAVNEDDPEAVAEHQIATAYNEALKTMPEAEAFAHAAAEADLDMPATFETNEDTEPENPEQMSEIDGSEDAEIHSDPDEPEEPIEVGEADGEGQDNEDTAANTGAAGTGAANAPAAGGGSGSGTTPPTPPVAGAGSGGAGRGGAGVSGGMPGYGGLPPIIPPTPALAPSSPAFAPAARIEHVPVYDQGPGYGSVLAAGIIGYFWGRRRGRIRTEKKLLPVQKKLEKQVVGLEQTITENEQKLRTAAREKARLENEKVQKNESLQALKNKSEIVIFAKQEQPTNVEPAPAKAPESTPAMATKIEASKQKASQLEIAQETGRKPAIEARQLHSPTPPQESIGKLLVGAEAVASLAAIVERKVLQTKEKQPTFPEGISSGGSIEKQVETLSRTELLTISEKVQVEGSTLRKIYETGLVSERGLRRLVAEYLHGGDVIKAFKRELVEREIDFERDPKMRDKIRGSLNGAQSGGSTAAPQTLDALLEAAGAGAGQEQSLEAAMLERQVEQQVKRQLKDSKEHRKRRIIDVSLATTIAVLASIVTIVIMMRK